MPRKSVIVSDRGYQDFEILYQWKKEEITFVMMLKKSIKYHQVKEFPLPEGRDEHIIKDEIISLTEEASKKYYPDNLRGVVIYDAQKDRTIEVITNNLSGTASTLAELYKRRWMIEIFFQELKHRYNSKCNVDIDLDSNDKFIDIEIFERNIKISLEFIEFDSVFKNEFICKNSINRMVG